MKQLRQKAIYAGGIVSALLLFAFDAYRPDERTGVMGFDLAWVRDTAAEMHTAILGMILAGIVVWILPMNWTDFRNRKLPDAVRAGNVVALAIIFYAIVSAVGQI